MINYQRHYLTVDPAHAKLRVILKDVQQNARIKCGRTEDDDEDTRCCVGYELTGKEKKRTTCVGSSPVRVAQLMKEQEKLS